MTVEVVISVCHPSHLPTWRHVAPCILRALRPAAATLVVPDGSERAFRQATPRAFIIERDSDHLGGWAPKLQARLDEADNGQRFGWYAQQFIKLSALERLAPGLRAVLWDADTLPLRPLQLFDTVGDPVFYAGSEQHSPYFRVIESLLGIGRQVDRSFIAQNLPVPTSWSSELFETLGGHGVWQDRIVTAIDPTQGSGFSEYETLGNFFAARWPDQIRWQPGSWTRSGYARFGSPAQAPWLTEDAAGPDFAAFETWERRRPALRRRVLGRLRRLSR